MLAEKGVVRVVIVDDHPILLEGTRACLSSAPDVRVVDTAGDGATALARVQTHVPDVLLLDIRLPDISGVEVARQVRSTYPSVAVVVLTGYDDPAYSRELRKLRVHGYLAKTATGPDIVAAVRAAPARAAREARSVPSTEAAAGPDLTGRELDVLRLLAAGRPNQAIADEIHIGRTTVELHLARILDKLGAHSRADAVARARELGLI